MNQRSEKISLRKLEENDFAFCMELLPRLKKHHFASYLSSTLSYLILKEGEALGMILASFLWEKLPFIEHFIIKEEEREKGFGTKSLLLYEEHLKEEGYSLVLLSTQADEKAQFLYRRLGYIDCGALFLENTPFDQAAEIFLKKNLLNKE